MILESKDNDAIMVLPDSTKTKFVAAIVTKEALSIAPKGFMEYMELQMSTYTHRCRKGGSTFKLGKEMHNVVDIAASLLATKAYVDKHKLRAGVLYLLVDVGKGRKSYYYGHPYVEPLIKTFYPLWDGEKVEYDFD